MSPDALEPDDRAGRLLRLAVVICVGVTIGVVTLALSEPPWQRPSARADAVDLSHRRDPDRVRRGGLLTLVARPDPPAAADPGAESASRALDPRSPPHGELRSEPLSRNPPQAFAPSSMACGHGSSAALTSGSLGRRGHPPARNLDLPTTAPWPQCAASPAPRAARSPWARPPAARSAVPRPRSPSHRPAW